MSNKKSKNKSNEPEEATKPPAGVDEDASESTAVTISHQSDEPVFESAYTANSTAPIDDNANADVINDSSDSPHTNSDTQTLHSEHTTNMNNTHNEEHDEKKTKTTALWFFVLLNLLLIIALCAGAAWVYYQWQQNTGSESDNLITLKTEVSNANAELEKLSRELNNANATLKNDIANAIASQQGQLSAELTNLKGQTENVSQETDILKRKVSELSGRRPADWLLAEADYLVRMAGRKLYLEKDVSTAMLMLQAADARLADLADPSLFPVRKLIAADIQSLHQVNPVSSNSVALAINGMLVQVDQLSLKALEIPEFEENEAANRLSDDLSDWQENLSKTWDAIVDDFIQVETSNEPILPYLSTKQRWLITEQLKLALAQAQSAALNEREILYQASIQQAMAIVVEHFQLDDTKVKQYLEALQQLSSTTVTKDYPRELSSSKALSDIIDERVKGVFGNDLLDDAINSQESNSSQNNTEDDVL
ncbi:uroporphyrinogen-III C-methyltransferase [Glaciecola sp. MH2013]|uniref:uroporphyrinogen-III C-methyltransferase n=1 Tax=Glaciecola sp. MH2013 TaxID=2785524 RepID=UPI00189FE9F2|nr:uroporphyrinogen-III C-methyltransferase [Glaciecola sp. MH2013]MBF7073516.1 uroporphyrinogen-III C-methyltransferase [Glaciecola sp. MH2013]